MNDHFRSFFLGSSLGEVAPKEPGVKEEESMWKAGLQKDNNFLGVAGSSACPRFRAFSSVTKNTCYSASGGLRRCCFILKDFSSSFF